MLSDYIQMKGTECEILLQESHLNMQNDIFQSIQEVIQSKNPRFIRINMESITRLNSNGIGRLVYIKKYINEECSLGIEFTNMSPLVLKTIKSVKVDDVLDI